jgi:hypothetical protein
MKGGSGGGQQQREALEPLTKQELQERARSAGLPVQRSMTKQDLIDALQSQVGAPRRSTPKANAAIRS